METTCGTTLQFSLPRTGLEKIEGKFNGFLRFSRRGRKDWGLKVINLSEFQWRSELTQHGRVSLTVSQACKDSRAPALESGNFHASFDGNWLLKNKAQEVSSCLNGRCIFLVGMMGSGKTTVGKILAEVLGYSFVDSDRYVEQALGESSVAHIFKQCGESIFREYETEALRKLSLVPRQVVATGGGAVVSPVNWKYMKQGVTVYLDVPLDALARRIAAVGTDSRPLLQFESGDPYTKAFMGLFTLSKRRGEAYANADATVSVQRIACKLGLEDLSDITPTAIAVEVLVQIENLLRGNNGMSIQMFS
ncbi:shikimate kinase 3, chloroplastic-like [Cornus florida]|uniref:shikimate kinase 3, chloroplastic-like n=1 Tax=Cornus florida TaxID=4283 RepID=UPI00289848A0|nr:shikimate kinase 3, chloroplastic-like [Cornus florida]XP_059631478.1 shikimate kinase 3, chloroplastic-like [Cornus florida]